ncbi:MAG TPA: YicC/YloC family endoribonuclease [Isosphaeraceae bacterium]|nr:YicC/YloC family endoribonuclease [Isosphaeraceae bacterium]
MLLSMTGFGEARHQDDRLSVSVEVRSVNNRHLKIASRISDAFSALEPEIDRLVRQSVKRGSILLSVRVDRPRLAEDYRLNTVALNSYREQIARLQGGNTAEVDLAALLVLPGVVEERRPDAADPSEDWPLLETTVNLALEQLQATRLEEGRAMADELLSLAQAVQESLALVEARVPQVATAYQERLLERLQNYIQDRVVLEPKDVIREVAILAERADVSEEIIRLKAHLAQYRSVIQGPESAGRKLEFVVQEMGRETNTIGSKANDVEISRAVVEMKSALEKIRELIQNVE